MKFKKLNVSGLEIFYRESGSPDKPVMILFHGFPSASHMFRDLIPMLEDKFHVIAPDYPGFGQSSMPSRKDFNYSFDNIADVMNEFIKALGLEKFFMYVFDYGAPIGFRIAMKNPEKILGIVSQNGNVYSEGLGKKWEARAKYWANPTKELREEYKSAFAPATIIGQYTFGTEEGSVSPDGYTLDIFYTNRPEYDEIQSDLIFDYQNNVKLYPKFQEYLRTYKPKLLAAWGKNDPSFIPAGAEAFKRDVPDAEIHFVNSGHFALESCCKEIADLILKFFA
ncbi:MAG: alpha/beta hydrolase [Synergistaceae bacterium]|nr:alpha/beta hydrolase [Synergistaceae bacterium]